MIYLIKVCCQEGCAKFVDRVCQLVIKGCGGGEALGAVALAADGRFFTHGKWPSEITVRRMEDGRVVKKLTVEEMGAVLLSPDGALLVVASQGGVRGYRVADGNVLFRFPMGEIIDEPALEISDDGNYLAIAALLRYGFAWRLWRLSDGVLLAGEDTPDYLSFHEISVCFSPDRRMQWTADGSWLDAGGYGQLFRIRVPGGDIETLAEHVRSFAVSDDGHYRVYSDTYTDTIIALDLQWGQVLYTWSLPTTVVSWEQIVVSLDGRMIAVIWDSERRTDFYNNKGSRIACWDAPYGVQPLAFSPDGRYIAIGDSTLAIAEGFRGDIPVYGRLYLLGWTGILPDYRCYTLRDSVTGQVPAEGKVGFTASTGYSYARFLLPAQIPTCCSPFPRCLSCREQCRYLASFILPKRLRFCTPVISTAITRSRCSIADRWWRHLVAWQAKIATVSTPT